MIKRDIMKFMLYHEMEV